MRQNNLTALFLALAIIVFGAGISFADTVNVAISGFAFNPSAIVINEGTYVRWTNNDAALHTATSDSPFWNSGNLSNGQSFVFLFDEPGEYPYHCTFHPTMTASVTVNAVSSVPSLNLYGILILTGLLISLGIMARLKKVRSK